MKKIMLFSVCSLVAFSGQAFAANCVYGCPSGASGDIINRPIYSLQNNSSTKFADWVAYQVTNVTIDGPSRSRNWKADPSLDASDTLEPADYTGAYANIHTDRGHQVPLAAFSNTSYWETTNYLSNITPQSSDLNQGPWVKIETAVRDLARSGQDVFVVTGPLYESYFATLPGADEDHTIPSGYFKVVITDNSGWVEASAFIFQQTVSRSVDYCNYEVTVDEVELRSGLNIMPDLPSSKESAVEGNTGGLTEALGC